MVVKNTYLSRYQYLLGKVSTRCRRGRKEVNGLYQYLLGKVSTEIVLVNFKPEDTEAYQYLLGKVSTDLFGRQRPNGISSRVSISIR